MVVFNQLVWLLVLLDIAWALPDGLKESTLKEKYRIKKPIYSKAKDSKYRVSKKDLEIKTVTSSNVGPSYEIVQMAKHPLTVKEYMEKEEKVRANDAKDEKEKLCMAARKEMFPNFLTKLGLITRMIDDVNDFRIRLKRSRSRMNEEGEKDLSWDSKTISRRTGSASPTDDVGLSVEATEAIWKLKKKAKLQDAGLAAYKKPLSKRKTNKLGKAKRKHRFANRQKTQTDKTQVPSCYGYQYLYAVDAVDDNGFPDVEVFQEYFSDLTDDKLALQLTDIMNQCSEPILADKSTSSRCPEFRGHRAWESDLLESGSGFSIPKACPEACLIDSDCDIGEVCCSNDCGGHTCHRNKNYESKQRSLCQDADEIMKCVYNNIKKKVCPEQWQ